MDLQIWLPVHAEEKEGVFPTSCRVASARYSKLQTRLHFPGQQHPYSVECNASCSTFSVWKGLPCSSAESRTVRICHCGTLPTLDDGNANTGVLH